MAQTISPSSKAKDKVIIMTDKSIDTFHIQHKIHKACLLAYHKQICPWVAVCRSLTFGGTDTEVFAATGNWSAPR